MKKNIKDYPPQIVKLFDKYVHGDIDRRGFLEGAAKYAIGATAAGAFLNSLVPDFANAQKIKPNDERLLSENVKITSPNASGFINALIVRPKNTGAKPIGVVIVVHENRGLNPHIEDIARRIALENYIAIAPDALSAIGGYPGNEDTARAKFQTLDQNKIRNDFLYVCEYAKNLDGGNGKIAMIGFCYGGGMVNYMATKVPYLRAGIAFYGAAAPLEEVKNIEASLMLHFAQDDERFNAMWPPYRDALEYYGKRFKAYNYKGTTHGFNNDTTPRYNEKMANLAWKRSMKFIKSRIS
jgi:carboxymethylenebutenolidase